METLEQTFETAFQETCRRAEADYGCGCRRLTASAEKLGTLTAVRQELDRKKLSENFQQLAERGGLEASVEALCAQGRFGQLFTDEQVNFCFQALCDAGYYRYSG